jgi:hypothetical protein
LSDSRTPNSSSISSKTGKLIKLTLVAIFAYRNQRLTFALTRPTRKPWGCLEE